MPNQPNSGRLGIRGRVSFPDPRNADKCPKNWKGGKSSDDAVGASVEVLVLAVTCGQCMDAVKTGKVILKTAEQSRNGSENAVDNSIID